MVETGLPPGPRVAVYGTGAVGGYFGGRLAEAGIHTAFVARGAGLAALRANGLTISSPLGDVTLTPVEATSDPSLLGPVELVILGTKAWQVSSAADAMSPLIGPDTAVLPLQNGVEAADQLSARLGPGPVLGGLCRIIARVERPGVVRHVGADPTVVFGELGGRPSERMRRIERLFAAARGVTAAPTTEIRAEIWKKFVFISAVSGVGAAARKPIGAVRRSPRTRELLRRCMEETRAVGAASGVRLAGSLVDDLMRFVDGLPADATPSMQRDILEGRPTELEAQNGAVVRLGLELGVPTPINTYLYDSLRPLDRRARGELEG